MTKPTRSGAKRDTAPTTKRPNERRMNPLAALRKHTRSQVQPMPVEHRIRAFLDGKTNGEDLLHALYDHVLDEPIPESMRALLKNK